MINAKRVCDNVEISLNDDFLASDKPSEIGAGLQPSCFEECSESIDLAGFNALIARVKAEHERYSTAMDVSMIVELHKVLPISRRQASDMRFWAWLGIECAPDFVAWRWKPGKDSSVRSRERYYGDRVRQTFSRIWWAAELTREGGDYELTTRLVNLPGFQDVYEAIFGRAFGSYRPAMAAFIEVAGHKSEKFSRELAKQLGYALTTTTLETMDELKLKEVIGGLVDKLEER